MSDSEANERCVRIAFCGASGTGKSTLANMIAEKYGLPSNPVGSRSVSQAMGFASPYDVDAAGKRAEFQRRLLTEKLAWERDHSRFVVDRTPLDNLLYTMLHDVASVDDGMLGQVRAGLAFYTHIVFCPVQAFCQVGDDTARAKSQAYQEVYDAALVGLRVRYLDASWARVLTLTRSELPVRFRAVCDFIEGKGREYGARI